VSRHFFTGPTILFCTLSLVLSCTGGNSEPGAPLVDVVAPDTNPDTTSPDGETPAPDTAVPEVFDMNACVVGNDENGETCSEELVLDFGTLTLGQTATGAVRVMNVGETMGTITSLTLDSEAYEVSAGLTADQPASLPLEIVPGGMAVVSVTLLPGTPSGTLTDTALDIRTESGDDAITIEVLILGKVGGCETGWGDCDEDPLNGCEIDTQTDTAHCGGCSSPCTVENGTASCVAGICTIECDPGYEGNGCATNTDDCADNTACVNGTCVDELAAFSCICDPGWDGEFCDINPDDCPALDPCDHGECLDGLGGFSCLCDKGWEGNLCDTNTNECNPDPCVNGTCSDNIGGYSCECEDGWTGPDCDEDIDDCAGVTACINGVCVDEFKGWHCECQPEWGGDLCDIKLETCADNPCVNGICSGEPGNITCTCDEGWIGKYCNIESDGGAPPGSIVVTTLEDGLADDGECTLREAIQSANTDTAVGGCTAGSGADTVALATPARLKVIWTSTTI